MSTIFTPSSTSSGTLAAVTLCGSASSATSQPAAASRGEMSSKRRSLRPVRCGCAAQIGSPTMSIDDTRTTSTSGWMSNRRSISAAPYPLPPMMAALNFLAMSISLLCPGAELTSPTRPILRA